MRLGEIVLDPKVQGEMWLVWEAGEFRAVKNRPEERRPNRETLAHIYFEGAEQVPSPSLRQIWREEARDKKRNSLPKVIADDAFLRMYALGRPVTVQFVRQLWKRMEHPPESHLNPISVGWNPDAKKFFDVDATPPGVLPKLFRVWRLKKDVELLKRVESDLKRAAEIEDPRRRRWLTLGILSHGAAYREIDGRVLHIPSFTEKGKLIPHTCQQHLIAEGIKTVSLVPTEKGAVGIYLCQGTELWPSQPSMLGSIIANFAQHGSATAAYAHSWRRIHKHLRDLNLPKPIVTGHSLGGALAIQIGLYSNDLIEHAYAFNPPLPHDRDDAFYRQMAPHRQDKVRVSANLDDFAFWRIGAKIVGKVRVFLGKRRWRYYPIGMWDLIFLFPAFVKFILNVRHAFPAHQNIAGLYENWVSFELSEEEIQKENQERLSRFDYLRFFPKLYDPLQVLLRFIRKLFGWTLKEEYLQNEIEIIALHERDVIDTLNEANRDDLERVLKELQRQKEQLIKQLNRVTRSPRRNP